MRAARLLGVGLKILNSKIRHYNIPLWWFTPIIPTALLSMLGQE